MKLLLKKRSQNNQNMVMEIGTIFAEPINKGYNTMKEGS